MRTELIEVCPMGDAVNELWGGNETKAARDLSMNRRTIKKWIVNKKIVHVIRKADGFGIKKVIPINK